MCDCIKNLEASLIDRDVNRKKVVKAQIANYFLMVGAGYQTHSEIELTLEGQKKKIIKPYAHKYCPLCGEKYPKDTEWKTIRP